MTYLVDRLAELRRHLDHLQELRPRIASAADLKSDLSLHNDVLYSLLTICQLVIDIAGELNGRSGQRFETYRDAIRNLMGIPPFSSKLVGELEKLPGFRNVVLHEYVALDLDRALEALDGLGAVEEFLVIVRDLETPPANR